MILGDRRLIGAREQGYHLLASFPNCPGFWFAMTITQNTALSFQRIVVNENQKLGGGGWEAPIYLVPSYTCFPAFIVRSILKAMKDWAWEAWAWEAGNKSNTNEGSSGIPGSYKVVQCGTPLPSVAKGCGTLWSALWLLSPLFYQYIRSNCRVKYWDWRSCPDVSNLFGLPRVDMLLSHVLTGDYITQVLCVGLTPLHT